MRIRTSTDLGGFLRARRNELGMDQATLARKAGTSRKWLIEAENGKPGVEIGMVLRTFRALDIAIDLSVDDQIIKTANKPRPALAERRSNRTPVNLDQRKGATTPSAAKITDVPAQLRRSSDSLRKATELPAKSSGFARKSTRRSDKSVRS